MPVGGDVVARIELGFAEAGFERNRDQMFTVVEDSGAVPQLEREESRLRVQQVADALGTRTDGPCAPRRKKHPLTEVPGASVSVPGTRSFSNLNSDTIGYRVDALRDVGLVEASGIRCRVSGCRGVRALMPTSLTPDT